MKTITLSILILFLRVVIANAFVTEMFNSFYYVFEYLPNTIYRLKNLRIFTLPNETESPQPLIINGVRAKPGEIPYYVSFRLRIRRKEELIDVTFCGGSLIATSKIISAAHCFAHFADKGFSGRIGADELKRVRVVAGTIENLQPLDSVSEPTQVRRLHSVAFFQYYITGLPYNDIAVVKPKTPFIETYAVQIIGYATQWKEYQGSCLASGFGIQKGKEVKYLYKADMPIMSTRECSFRFLMISSKDLVCSTITYTSVSPGDSGGPLVCSNTGDPREGPLGLLVGAAVAVSPRLGVGLYSRTSSHTNFIVKNNAFITSQRLTSSVYIGFLVTYVNVT